MVGLQAQKFQVRCIRDAACEQCGISARWHAAALHADFDFDKPAERDAEIPRRAGCRVDLVRSIEAQRDGRLLCKRGQPPQLAFADYLIAHQHVLHTAANEHFRFADFLHALADRAACDLSQRNRSRLVGLGMRPHAHPRDFGELGHLCDVAVESVEIDDQRGGLDLGDGYAYLGGRRVHLFATGALDATIFNGRLACP